MEIKNKVVIVTGASSGIGLAVSRLLTEQGAKVALVARSKDKLEAISKELPESFVAHADMSEEIEIKKMVEAVKNHFGRIDILINNAGQGYDSLIEKTNIDTFRYIFEFDVLGPIIAMKEVIPIMRKQGEGMIVNISSATALMYLPNMGAYSSMKRALANISLTAREELKEDKIVVSVVYPYITLTDFEKNTIRNTEDGGWEQDGEPPFPPDSAEYVAEKIIEGIISEEAEIFIHDWMKKGMV